MAIPAQKLSNGSSIKIAIEPFQDARVAIITLVLCNKLDGFVVVQRQKKDVFSFKLSCHCKK